MTEQLKMNMIRLDGGTQPRAELRYDIIDDYANEMLEGTQFPDVVVFYDGADYWLSDGYHRYHAAKRAGREDINADVHQGTRRDAVLFSVGVNSEHGLRRTNEDKQRAVWTLLCDSEWGQWSDREIARRCRVTHPTVANLRRKKSLVNVTSEKTYTTRHGTVATMNTANIGVKPAVSEATRSTAQRITEQATQRRAAELAIALEGAPAPVVALAEKHAFDEPERLEFLTHQQQHNPDTFEEIVRSGFIQPGDEEDAVPITAPMPQLREAMAKKSNGHAIIGAQAGAALSDHQRLNLSTNNEWYTPPQYIASVHEVLGQVDVDPASNTTANQTIKATTIYTIDDDGFDQKWRGKVYMNPPYGFDDGESNQSRWTKRLIEQYHAGIVTEAIMLVNAVPGNKWFAPLWEFPICFVDHRIRFYNEETEAGQPTHSNVFVYLGPNIDRFWDVFSKHGVVATRYVPRVIEGKGDGRTFKAEPTAA